MKAFMDKDFLLDTATARRLYHDYAAGPRRPDTAGSPACER